MALNQVERKILERARELIRDRGYKYVCYAINDIQLQEVPKAEVISAKYRLKKYIERKLGEHPTLGSWAAQKHSGRWMNEDLQREARIAWITWMLDEKITLDKNWRRAFDVYA